MHNRIKIVLSNPLFRVGVAVVLLGAFGYLIAFHEELAHIVGRISPILFGAGVLIAGFLPKFKGSYKRLYYIGIGAVLIITSFVNLYLYIY